MGNETFYWDGPIIFKLYYLAHFKDAYKIIKHNGIKST